MLVMQSSDALTSGLGRPKRGTASERIIIAATSLLVGDEGQLEVDRLAAAAGCSTGAIYHNFGSKAGVISAVTGRYNAKLAELVVPASMPSDRAAWLAAMRAALDATVAFMWGDPLTPVIATETVREAGVAAEAERWLNTHVRLLADQLAAAQAAGHLAAEADVEVLAAGVAGGLRQILRVLVTRPDRPDFAHVRSAAWAFVRPQLRAPARRDS